MLVGLTQNISAQFRRNYKGFSSQTNLEIGVGAGPSMYQGDLSYDIINLKFIAWNIGAYIRTAFSKRIYFRTGIHFGKIKGDDKAYGNLYDPIQYPYGRGSSRQSVFYQRYKRNLNFNSYIFEWNVLAEINLYDPRTKRPPGRPLPYLFGGLGIFRFNPRTVDRYGNKVLLRYHATEMYKHYSKWQFCIPIGLGVRINPDQQFSVSIEGGWRKTFTDWIDDISHNYAGPSAANNKYLKELSDRSGEVNPAWGDMWDKVTLDPNQYIRGNPKTKDSYYFLMVCLNYKLSRYTTCTNF